MFFTSDIIKPFQKHEYQQKTIYNDRIVYQTKIQKHIFV